MTVMCDDGERKGGRESIPGATINVLPLLSFWQVYNQTLLIFHQLFQLASEGEVSEFWKIKGFLTDSFVLAFVPRKEHLGFAESAFNFCDINALCTFGWMAWEELIWREASVRFWGRHLWWKEGCCLENRTSPSSSGRAPERTRCLWCTWGLWTGVGRWMVIVTKHLASAEAFHVLSLLNPVISKLQRIETHKVQITCPGSHNWEMQLGFDPKGCLKSYLFPFRYFSSCMFVLSDESWNARYSSLRDLAESEKSWIWPSSWSDPSHSLTPEPTYLYL